MIQCPACHKTVSETAKSCPHCGDDFAERRRREAAAAAALGALIVLAATIVIAIILLPAVIINVARGRYRERTGNLLAAALRDWQTYAISAPVAVIAMIAIGSAVKTERARNDEVSANEMVKQNRVVAPSTRRTDVSTANPRVTSSRSPEVFTSPSQPITTGARNFQLATPPSDAAVSGSSPSPPATPVPYSFFPPETAPSVAPVLYRVVGIGFGDALNIRAGPGTQYPSVEKLANGFAGIQVLGPPVANGPDQWVQIRVADTQGWVNAKYLQPNAPH